MQGNLREVGARAAKDGKASSRYRKMALQRDVDKLKKKLRHEENVHRALERALNRPLGALPRLPPFLPPCILALLAEVAVLEEEIARLEEQVVDLRQDMYEEAVYMSSSRRRKEHVARSNNAHSIEKPDKMQPLSQAKTDSAITLPKDKHGKENQSCSNSSKSSKKSKRPGPTTRTAIIKLPTENKSVQKLRGLPLRQPDARLNDKPVAETRNPNAHEKPRGDESPNTISEKIVKCLSSILLRMSSVRNTGPANDTPCLRGLKTGNYVEGTESWDPYSICFEFGKRDIGPYKQLCAIEAKSFNPKRTSNSLFLLSRLKLLLRKLASVSLENLNYQEKLAFWINIYNSCMINAFIENGVPESPEMAIALMRKATINVGGYMLSATTIEHCILRLPYRLKLPFSKGAKNHEMTARSSFGLELSEPLVTFALCCGTWSSPAVRVYTASQVEEELEVAKREYLQAAIGISTTKFAIPKLLSWYLLDFAKDLESLLDWICLQLPSELGKEAINFLEKRKTEPLSQFVQILPYEFTFRYLICT